MLTMRNCTKSFALVTLAAVLMLATSNLSSAAPINLYLQEDGGAITPVATGASVASFSGAFGDFTVSNFGALQIDGASLSQLMQAATNVTNNSGVSHTLSLWASAGGYTLPVGSGLTTTSGLGGSMSNGALTPTFQTFADKANALLGVGDFTNGVQSALFNGSTFDTGSAVGLFTRLGTPFSVTTVTSLIMGGGGVANFSSQVGLTSGPENAPLPTPEPASFAAWSLVGLVGLTISRRFRKRPNPLG